MKKRIIFINILTLLFLLSSFKMGLAYFQRIDENYLNWNNFDPVDVQNDNLDYNKIEWVELSKNLKEKITADDPETQCLAMREIILYNYLSDNTLEIDETVFDLINIYETNKDPKVRQLAVVALHSIGNDWSMNYLCDNIKFEKNENLRKFMAYCLCDYHKNSVVVTHLAD